MGGETERTGERIGETCRLLAPQRKRYRAVIGHRVIGANHPRFTMIHTYVMRQGYPTHTFPHLTSLSRKCVGRASPGVALRTLSAVVPAQPHPPISPTMNPRQTKFMTPASLASSP